MTKNAYMTFVGFFLLKIKWDCYLWLWWQDDIAHTSWITPSSIGTQIYLQIVAVVESQKLNVVVKINEHRKKLNASGLVHFSLRISFRLNNVYNFLISLSICVRRATFLPLFIILRIIWHTSIFIYFSSSFYTLNKSIWSIYHVSLCIYLQWQLLLRSSFAGHHFMRNDW